MVVFVSLEGQGCGPLGSEGALGGIPNPVCEASSTIPGAHSLCKLLFQFHQRERQVLVVKAVVKLAPSFLVFYSWMFFVQKSSGAWHPIIDLLTLNRCVVTSEFHMETTWSVLQSIQQNDWIFSIDLKDGYPRVFFHLHSHQYLRFVCHGQTFQFRFRRFGLAMAPQVFMVGFTCVGNSPSTGHPDTLVSGQLVDSCSVVTSGSSCKGLGFGCTSRAWHPCIPVELASSTLSVIRLSGDEVGIP